ncbi:mitochondrial F-box protein MFB1 [Saccharomyces cerevisiae]|nr:mitochondrial F-box protein MFB1 [Saccharomyces cerevisiae]CAI4360228.1 CEL_1a_G0010750.mRNA.1.CDS.1 [Saccharomyces cerevisiae]CAI7207537.1 CEL_1a_G0010750.mRNA.1.CDS.1 [Saccharomyces cerevisiae]
MTLFSCSVQMPLEERSLTNLPLNLLFRILSHLDMNDLQNIGKTCTLLRMLANENIVYRNAVIGSNGNMWWTKNVLVDVFDVLNFNRKAMKTLNSHNISLVASLRNVQRKYKLGVIDPARKTISYRTNEVESKEKGSVKDLNMDLNEPKEITREQIAHTAILQGMNQFIELNDKAFRTHSADSDDTYIEENNGEIHSLNGLEKNTTFEEDLVKKPPFIPSPTFSNYSRSSTNSVFSSSSPKLLDDDWNNITTDFTKSRDPDYKEVTPTSTESSDSITRLRKSNKVKDKAELFEKLIFRDSRPLKTKKKDNPRLKLSSSLSANDEDFRKIISPPSDILPKVGRRSVSRGYLEEIERHYPDFNGETTNPLAIKRVNSTKIANYEQLIIKENSSNCKGITEKNDENKFQRSHTSPVIESSKPHQRSKLKAVVTDGNKICYRKIELDNPSGSNTNDHVIKRLDANTDFNI